MEPKIQSSRAEPAPAARLLARWRKLSHSRWGRWLFSRALGRTARYSGTIRPLVLELGPGHCRVRMRDRPAVRNHLQSVHAIALLNLGEIASGLALLAGLPPGARAILVGLSMDYRKKARGTLEARCRCVPPADAVAAPAEVEIRAAIHDESGDVVAEARARWRVGPGPETGR